MPTSANDINAPINPQMGPQEHCTWHHEDPAKVFFSHRQINFTPYTHHRGIHLARNTVPNQVHIYFRDLYNKLPDTTNGCGTYGQTQTHERGTLLPMHQGLTQGEYHYHALHYQKVVVESPDKLGHCVICPGAIL